MSAKKRNKKKRGWSMKVTVITNPDGSRNYVCGQPYETPQEYLEAHRENKDASRQRIDPTLLS